MYPLTLSYATRLLAFFASPPALAHGFLVYTHTSPLVLRAVIYLSSYPLCLFLWILHANFQDQRQADALGGVLPPWIEDSSGGLKTLRAMLDSVKNGYIGDVMADWAGKYGWTYNTRILFQNRIVTAEPEHIKAMLATNFSEFEKGWAFRWPMQSMLGTGVFNADGDMWRFHRSMTRPFFSKERLSELALFERQTERAITLLRRRLRQGFAVDIQDLVSRFTLDVSTEFLFGTNVGSLSAVLPYPAAHAAAHPVAEHPTDVFVRAFMHAQERSALRSWRGAVWPLLELKGDTVSEDMEVIYKFTEPIVRGAIVRKAARNDVVEHKMNVEEAFPEQKIHRDETLLDHLVEMTEDPSVLRDETLNILLAGRDTTSCLLSFAVYALAENPQVLAQLRAEILSKLGEDGRPTRDDIRSMPYLRAVLNECLRLWPPVPFNVRQAKEAALWPPTRPGEKPFYIPAGTKCTYSVFLMHRRTDLWGPDANVFDPNRFLDERLQTYFLAKPFIFLPFNAGPRICLGQQFAYDEASYFLIRLVQSFSEMQLALDATPHDALPPWEGRERVWMQNHLTLHIKGGLWVRMTETE